MDAEKSKANKNYRTVSFIDRLFYLAFHAILRLWYFDVSNSAHDHWKSNHHSDTSKKSKQQNSFIYICYCCPFRIILLLNSLELHARKSQILNPIKMAKVCQNNGCHSRWLFCFYNFSLSISFMV